MAKKKTAPADDQQQSDKPQHGGKREGAGRKADGERKISSGVSVSADAWATWQEVGKRHGLNRSQWIEFACSAMLLVDPRDLAFRAHQAGQPVGEYVRDRLEND